MHRWLVILFALVLAASCRADDAATNRLTSKEIAEGWILLFDGETTFGWDAAGKPSVKGGVLLHGSDQDLRASTKTAFRLYELHFEYLIEKSVQDAAAVTFQSVPLAKAAIALRKHKGWASSRLHVKDGEISGTVEEITENSVVEIQVLNQITKPKIAATPQSVSFSVPKGNKLSLRNVKLKPLDVKAIFNGKGLTGWKEFPGRKSQFSITKEGWLSIRNGPGDLQTTEQWSDFVLQLECRTNGDNLNSGVFFRCLPNEYQQGYEAQIQNQHAKQLKTYTVDEYDAATHKLKDKKSIANWSQDYGTGAIYRRIPARRPEAKDREWFTMTIVARGRHIATWVNGIQVVDWDDHRPAAKNARNGCRVEKGCISLQGHDPTTDLTFRNIRLADLDAR